MATNDLILNELKSINKRMDTFEKGQQELKQGQAQTNTALDALAAGQ